MTTENLSPDDLAAIRRCGDWSGELRGELSKTIVGRRDAIDTLLIALVARGHVLLRCPAGVGKSLLVGSIAAACGLSFRRIDLTADLSASDLTGRETTREDVETGRRRREFSPGPVWSNCILADQVDRTPPTVQSMLLEAMKSGELHVEGQVREIPDPFFVVAAQDPFGSERDSPLLQAQLDRFMLHVELDYPEAAEEWEIARLASAGRPSAVSRPAGCEQLVGFQDLVARLPVGDEALAYAWALVRSSRPNQAETIGFVDRWVAWGAGPRGLLALVAAAKAKAVLQGRPEATVDDVRSVAMPVLRHRVAGNETAEANALSSDRLIELLLEALPPEAHYEKPPELSDR